MTSEEEQEEGEAAGENGSRESMGKKKEYKEINREFFLLVKTAGGSTL
jgi:hypothetical protein